VTERDKEWFWYKVFNLFHGYVRMKGRPVFRKAGIALTEYPAGKDTVFILPSYAGDKGFHVIRGGGEGHSLTTAGVPPCTPSAEKLDLEDSKKFISP
jgi:hypothetical protein